MDGEGTGRTSDLEGLAGMYAYCYLFKQSYPFDVPAFEARSAELFTSELSGECTVQVTSQEKGFTDVSALTSDEHEQVAQSDK